MNAENTKRDNATLWIVVPFALAIVGTVVMLFTNSANVLKVSLILALWAAVAGIILVTRLRRDRDQAQRELVARSERFEAELDAAQARGEADRVLLERARSGSDTASSIDVEVLREIQAELARLAPPPPLQGPASSPVAPQCCVHCVVGAGVPRCPAGAPTPGR